MTSQHEAEEALDTLARYYATNQNREKAQTMRENISSYISYLESEVQRLTEKRAVIKSTEDEQT